MIWLEMGGQVYGLSFHCGDRPSSPFLGEGAFPWHARLEPVLKFALLNAKNLSLTSFLPTAGARRQRAATPRRTAVL